LEKENLASEKNYEIKLEDSIDVLTTDDKRLNIIGEELSNETGRAILAKLFDGVNSTSEIASSLNISIPLARWHIMRLSEVGLIKKSETKLSQKNTPVQHYEPIKFALVIVPSKLTKPGTHTEILKTALKKMYRYLPVFAAFLVSTASLYLLKTVNQPNGYSYDMRSFPANQLFYINPDLAISLIVGMLFAVVALVVVRRLHRKKRNT
jgi:DNA-binding transcriptional ArsR family regulator